MNHDMLIAIDDEDLNEVAGGTGCLLPSPCDVVQGVLGVVGEVVDAKKQLLECGVKTLESFLCPGN